jgi:hypothetical protein
LIFLQLTQTRKGAHITKKNRLPQVFSGICTDFRQKKGTAMEVAMPKPPKEDGGVFHV